MTAPGGSGIADAARSIPWRLLAPSAVILVAAWLTPVSELSSNQGDLGLYLQKAHGLASGLVPYRDFPFEYPPLALVPMVVPYLLWPFGAVSLDGYRWLFVAWEAGLMLAVAVVLARIVRLVRGDRVAGGTGAIGANARAGVASMANRLVVVTIGAALAIAFRFDLFPALLVTVALWAALDGRPGVAGVAVGIGILAKLYPLGVVPALAIPWLIPLDPRRLVRYGAALVLTLVLVLVPFVALAGSDTLAFLSYQADRGLQIESIGGGLAVLGGLLAGHPPELSFGFSSVQVEGPFARAWLGLLPILTVAGFGLLGMLGLRRLGRGRGPAGTIVAFAFAAVLVVLATSKVFSIQYVVWIVPFAALLPGRRFWLAAALVALTMPIHPLLYGDLVKQEPLPILILNLRNVLFLALTAWTLRDLARGDAQEAALTGRPAAAGA